MNDLPLPSGTDVYDTLVRIEKHLERISMQLASAPQSGGSGENQDLPLGNRSQDANGNWDWDAPPAEAPAKPCKECGLEVYWVRSRKGKAVPLDKAGGCHYETCPVKKARSDAPPSPAPAAPAMPAGTPSQGLPDLPGGSPF